MRLLTAPASPFGRKVKIVAHVKGVADHIEMIAVDTRGPDASLITAANPLGKIPVLIFDNGEAVYDSRVIVEVLDHMRPEPALIPPWGEGRERVLTRAALADGLMEAALAIVYEERFRAPAEWSASWVARQQGKVDAALQALAVRTPARGPYFDAHPTYDHIAIACALGYLDLRFAGAWRAQHPALVTWLHAFASAVPAFAATTPSG